MSSTSTPTRSPEPTTGSNRNLWFGAGTIAIFVAVLVIGKFSGLIEPLELAQALQVEIRRFAETPWGPAALIATFCLGAFIAVPQFVLIGVSVYAFGPIAGAFWAWGATLCSGSLNYGIGRYFGRGLMDRFAGPRVKAFSAFVARKTFVASAVVRNVPAGPFLFVNMLFGAVRASFLRYISGMALGILPKIVFVTFGYQAVMAVLTGNVLVAVLAGCAALAIFLGGWFYVRYKRRRGEIVALDSD